MEREIPMVSIYGIFSKCNHINLYVGASLKYLERFAQHIDELEPECECRKCLCIRKFVLLESEYPEVIELEKASLLIWNEVERKWGRYYRSIGQNEGSAPGADGYGLNINALKKRHLDPEFDEAMRLIHANNLSSYTGTLRHREISSKTMTRTLSNPEFKLMMEPIRAENGRNRLRIYNSDPDNIRESSRKLTAYNKSQEHRLKASETTGRRNCFNYHSRRGLSKIGCKYCGEL